MILHVFGHPRSGNHYLGTLLEANNFGPLNREKYGPLGSSHRWPPPFAGELLGKLFDSGEDNRFIYIWRNFNDVALSNMAKEKPRRMSVDLSLDSFSHTPWEDLIGAGLVQSHLLNRWVMEDQRHMTPYECWKEHVEKWLSFAEARTDVYIVKYENLMNRFQRTMSDMALWLGIERNSFENISKKVDPAPVREGGFRGEM